MVKNAIKIYGRIKPVVKRKDVGQYFIQEGSKEDTLFLQVRERDYHEDQHHKAELSQFKFYKVFDQHVRQHELFSSVAKPIVDSVLQGYNGTVFAYGQTGSGKTFTITGGPDDFEDRGLIPRAIEYVFRKIASADGSLYTVCVTYLQIYNEAAYDLLGHHQRMARLEDLPKLNLLDDTEGYLHIRNLSLHPVNSENEALNLLFLGDTNRAIAETPMNQASSRSHCMFTIHLAIRRTSWKNTRRAKLHFVDLAGSERLNKKGGRNPGTIDGRTINEARHINLSLHYLEQVITALAEAKRVHVPYRNCIITTMLRDSIGGNCLTSMVATLSLDHHHLPETLATCRFAQRVALVKNDATLNEDRDPVQEVSVLKTEVKKLKDQIRLLTNDKHYGDTHLTAAEETECRELIEAFLENSQPLELPSDLRKIEYCCLLLKEAVVEARKGNNIPRHEKGSQHVEKCMQKLLQQRNNEIAILTELLRKERKHRMNSKSPKRSLSPPMPKPSIDEYQKLIRQAGVSLNKHEQAALKKYAANPAHTNEVDNLKAQLRIRHNAAKKIHDKIEENKARIVESRKMLAKLENGIPVSSNVASRQKQLQAELKGILELEQSKYCSNLGILRDLKNECDHLSHSLKQAEVHFLHNFQYWWTSQGHAIIIPKHTPPQEIPQKLVENPRIDMNMPMSNSGDVKEYNTTRNMISQISTNVPLNYHSASPAGASHIPHAYQSQSVQNIGNSSALSDKNLSPTATKSELIRKDSNIGVSALKLQCLSRESQGDFFTCEELSFDDIQNMSNSDRHLSPLKNELAGRDDLERSYHTESEGLENSTHTGFENYGRSPHNETDSFQRSFHKEYNSFDSYFPTHHNNTGNKIREDYEWWYPCPTINDSLLLTPSRTDKASATARQDFSQRTFLVKECGTGDFLNKEDEIHDKHENTSKRKINAKSTRPLTIRGQNPHKSGECKKTMDLSPFPEFVNHSPLSILIEDRTPPGTPPSAFNEQSKSDTNFAHSSQDNIPKRDNFNTILTPSYEDSYNFCDSASDISKKLAPNFQTSYEQNPQFLTGNGKIPISDTEHTYFGSNTDFSGQKPLRLATEYQMQPPYHAETGHFMNDDTNNMKEQKEATTSSAPLNTNLQDLDKVITSADCTQHIQENNRTQISFKDIPLTGDKEVDEEIIAFYEAKQRALQRQSIG